MPNLVKGNPRTVIQGGLVVGYQQGEHRILKDGYVVYEGNCIVHVGPDYDGETGTIIDASKHLVIPGLINTHVHVGSQAGDRMVLDAGRRDLFRSGFLNHWPSKGVRGPNLFAFEEVEGPLKYSLASLLRFGSTTVVEMGGEMGGGPGGLAAMAAELGLRLYTSPGFASASHYYDQAGRLNRHWDEKAGLEGLDAAIRFAEEIDGKYDDLIRPILVPYELYTSTPELLRRTKRAAETHKLPITMHVAEAIVEFHDTVRETGRTPIEHLDSIGFLGPEVILGHCLYTSGHSQTCYPFPGDVRRVAQSGASVAHCPAVFSRRGLMLESFDRYLAEGVNLSIGTDSYPQDIIDELKYASIACKLAERSPEAGRARDVFNAATLGGAKALRREDLGRLSPGAKADIVLVDLDRMRIGPFLDPIKALIHCANGDLVDRVIVNGRTVVAGGRVLAWDEAELTAAVRRSTNAAWARFGDYHNGPEPLDVAYPNAFKAWS
ncbi:MAG: chlorohydrolase family protein [Hyphomicrobiaceae bacterium]